MREKKFLAKILCLCIFNVLTTIGCSEPRFGTTINFNKFTGKSSLRTPPGGLTFGNSDKAEDLALKAEQLFFSPMILESKQFFEKALTLDSSNVRARLYMAYLDFTPELKGIEKKTKSLREKLILKQREMLQEDFDVFPPDSDFRKFLLDSQEEFKSELEFRNFIIQVRAKLQELRRKITGLSKNKITLHVRVLSDGARKKDIFKKCPANKISEGEYFISDCLELSNKSLTVERADWEAMKLAVMRFQMEKTNFVVAYNPTGFIEAYNKSESAPSDAGKKPHFDAIRNAHKDFGTLIDSTALQEIIEMGKEAQPVMEYIAKNQKTLCRAGQPREDNRPGKLVEYGICQDEDMQNVTPIMKNASQGRFEYHRPIKETLRFAGRDSEGVPYYRKRPAYIYKTMLDLRTVANGSIPDLKLKAPEYFTSDGCVALLPDNTLGGGFPLNDALEYFDAVDHPSFRSDCNPDFRLL